MPTLGVNTVIVQDGRVLLIKRTDIPVWALPGGGVEPHESLMHAGIRETREETGLHVEIEELTGLYSRPFWRGGGDHIACFLCHPTSGEVKISTDESSDCRFWVPDRLPSDLWPPHLEMIQDALSGNGCTVCRTSLERWPFADDDWASLIGAFSAAGLEPEEFFRKHGIGSAQTRLLRPTNRERQ